MILINIEHIILTTEGNKIFNIKIEIPTHEIICISGSSGVGKTTLFRIISGLITPKKGRIQIDNQVFFDSEKKINISPQNRKIGFMFQDYALFPNMNVEENIAFAQPKNKDINKVDELIKIMDLNTLRKQKVTQLSGGQKQRVALARTLATESKLLLLDEPLSAIDNILRKELQEQILQIHQLLKPSILWVSHDSDEINKLASYILCLESEKSWLVKNNSA